MIFHELANIPNKVKRRRDIFERENKNCTSDWVDNYVSPRDWLVAVDDAYLNDNFHFHGLAPDFANYSATVNMIRGYCYDYDSPRISQRDGAALYAAIHARFIMTSAGSKLILPKFKQGVYGVCPRLSCDNQCLLPIGLNGVFGQSTAKTFCPKCQDVYDTESQIDGAFFGPGFPHFFLHVLKHELKINPLVETEYGFMGVPVDQSGKEKRRPVHNTDPFEL